MNFFKTHAATILIAVAVIITGYILGNAYLSKGKADPEISVTGLFISSITAELVVVQVPVPNNGEFAVIFVPVADSQMV